MEDRVSDGIQRKSERCKPEQFPAKKNCSKLSETEVPLYPDRTLRVITGSHTSTNCPRVSVTINSVYEFQPPGKGTQTQPNQAELL